VDLYNTDCQQWFVGCLCHLVLQHVNISRIILMCSIVFIWGGRL